MVYLGASPDLVQCKIVFLILFKLPSFPQSRLEARLNILTWLISPSIYIFFYKFSYFDFKCPTSLQVQNLYDISGWICQKRTMLLPQHIDQYQINPIKIILHTNSTFLPLIFFFNKRHNGRHEKPLHLPLHRHKLRGRSSGSELQHHKQLHLHGVGRRRARRRLKA